MSYSTDLREKIVAFLEAGLSIAEAARIFGVSRPTIYNWVRKKKDLGSLKDKPPARPWRKLDPQALMLLVEKHPDWTLEEYGKHFGIKPSSMFNAFRRLKITRKKRLCDTKKGMKRSVQHFWSRSPVTLDTPASS